MKTNRSAWRWLSVCLIGMLWWPMNGSAQTGGTAWEYGPQMNRTRISAFTAQLEDGRNIVLGGREAGFVSCIYADAYDPVSKGFTEYVMNTPHDMGAVTRMQDGRYFISGGGGNSGIAPGYAEAEIFDPTDNSFTSIGSMTMGRMQHSTVTLSDGRVLIVGAWYNGIGAAEPEIYDPVYNTFEATAGDLIYPRAGAVVLPTDDGGAVVMGGWPTFGGDIFTEVEYFDPATSTFSELISELLPADPGWQVHGFTEYRPQEEKMMYNGKYVFKAYKGSGPSTEYTLITFDPATKSFDEIDLSESLMQHDIISYYDMVLNSDGSYAYLLGVDINTDPYPTYLVTVDLANGTVFMPDESFQLASGEYLLPTMSWIPSEEQILVTGISTSSTDYFHATDRTLLLTPEWKGTALQEVLFNPWQVYPNPGEGILYVSGQTDQLQSIVISDMQGRMVLNQQYQTISDAMVRLDASHLPAGTYVLSIREGATMWTHQIVICK